MKSHNLILFLLFLSFWVNAQETIVNGNFAIRDFLIQEDSLYFIEKRDIKYFDYTSKNTSFNQYFAGGYGLKIFNDSVNNEIISVSNEFEQTVSSVRFYSNLSKEVVDVFYYKEGKAINAILVPEFKRIVLSMTNNKIIVLDYSAKPDFKVIYEIALKSLARSFDINDNGLLLYATDLGNVYNYNLTTKNNNLIYSVSELITDLKFYNHYIIISTISGKIIKYNTIEKKESSIKVKDNFVLNTLIADDKLICGTFGGSIIVVNFNNMKLINSLNYHKKSILKITQIAGNEFYSSSIDKTIKKWKLN